MGWIFVAFFSYRLGRIGERRNKMEAARRQLVALVSSWQFKAESTENLTRLRDDSIAEIEKDVFAFVAHIPERKRPKIEQALRAFREIDYRELRTTVVEDHEVKLSEERLAHARVIVVTSLGNLRAHAEKG
jgi:hypothetical protein